MHQVRPRDDAHQHSIRERRPLLAADARRRGPGENEDATGLPFVGRAGKLLDDILAAVDLTRQQVYLTNTVKCRAASRRAAG
jgi:hypothetical protein